jgi:hypothetical protein
MEARHIDTVGQLDELKQQLRDMQAAAAAAAGGGDREPLDEEEVMARLQGGIASYQVRAGSGSGWCLRV